MKTVSSQFYNVVSKAAFTVTKINVNSYNVSKTQKLSISMMEKFKIIIF